MDNKKKIHLAVDNLAVPEIRYDEEDEFEDDEEEIGIGFSGAVPEIHIKGKKEENK